MKLVKIRMKENFEVDIEAVKAAITSNTGLFVHVCLFVHSFIFVFSHSYCDFHVLSFFLSTVVIVGSAPQFPYGVIDNIVELAAIAKSRGIGFHTDACLGGFFLPWARLKQYEQTRTQTYTQA